MGGCGDGELKGNPVEVVSYQNVKEAVETLSSYNYVHGNLCPQNLLVFQDGSLRVADFDWAGVAGQVCYPLDLNQHCNWHPDTAAGTVL